MKNILVMQLYRYGDMLQSTPAIAALRKAQPEARITVLVRKPSSDVLRNNPDIDEVLEWDIGALNADLLKEGIPREQKMDLLRASLAPVRRQYYDTVYNLASDMPSALLTCLMKPRQAVGLVFHADRRYRVRNEWMQYLFLSTEGRFLNAANLVDFFVEACGEKVISTPRLTLDREDEPFADRILSGHSDAREKLIGIQAGASKDYKKWPAENFGHLARRLLRSGHGLIFFGSAHEKSCVDKIIHGLPRHAESVVNVAGKTTFHQLAALLKRCRWLISNDTATVHAAAAVQTPCLVLTFGPTSAWETAPYGEGHYVLEPATRCFPCSWSEICPALPCRDLLSVDAVGAAFDCMMSDGRHVPQALADSPTRLYRTEWMPDGFLGLRPLNRPPMTLRDLLRSVLRSYFLNRRLRPRRQVPVRNWRPWTREMFDWYGIEDTRSLLQQVAKAAGNFAALQKLADLGSQAAGAAVAWDGQAGPCDNGAAHLEQAAAKLQERVLEAERNEVLRFLVTAFRHTFRDAEDLCGRRTALLHLRNYQRLSEGCAYVREALNEFAAYAMSAARPSATPANNTCDLDKVTV